MSLIKIVGIICLVLATRSVLAIEAHCLPLLSPVETNFEWVDEIVKQDHKEVEALISKIVEKYPVATTEFIFVGRSPSLLAAYMQAQSKIFKATRSWILPVSLTSKEVLSPIMRKRFYDLWSTYRNPEWPLDRNVVFIDFVMEGRTFSQLERLLLEGGVKGELVGFSYGSELRQSQLNQQLLSSKSQVLPISFEFEMRISLHKNLAAYPSLSPGLNNYSVQQINENKSEAFLRAVRWFEKEFGL